MARFKEGQRVKLDNGTIAMISLVEKTPDGTPYYNLVDNNLVEYNRYTENTMEELFKPSTKVRINSTHGSSFRYQEGVVINSDYLMTFSIQVRLNGNGMYSYFKEEELDLVLETGAIMPVTTHSKLSTKPDYTSLKNVNVETEDLTNVSTEAKEYTNLFYTEGFSPNIKKIESVNDKMKRFSKSLNDILDSCEEIKNSSCCCSYCSPPTKELKVKEKNIKTFTKLDVDEDIKARKKLEAKISASRRRVEKVKESFIPKEKSNFRSIALTVSILSVLALGILYAILF